MGHAPRPSGRTRHLTYEQRRDGWELSICPTCKGSGKRGVRKCGLCKGRGEVLTHK